LALIFGSFDVNTEHTHASSVRPVAELVLQKIQAANLGWQQETLSVSLIVLQFISR
jgi:hypothetical protein